MLEQPNLEYAATLAGETPLHWAVHGGANTALICLRSHSASLTKTNKEGEMALHIAAKKRNGFSSTVEVLLKMKSPTDMRTYDGCTPLHLAAQGK